MKFVRAIWKLLVGIKDALVLLFMLLFFGLLYAGLSARPAAGRRRRARARPRRQRGRAAGQGRRWPSLPAAAADSTNIACATSSPRSTRRADDDRVKAVALDLDGFLGGGQAAIVDLADALRRVRKSGKPVLAYATGYTDDGYQLAAAASEVWLNPLGAVAIAGPGGIEPLFQGPARQARRDRQRLSRRHLQVGGRAVHPQRHVARGARRITRRSARRCSKPGARASLKRARPKAKVDAVSARHAGGGRRRPAATWPRRRSTPGWSTSSATAARSRRGWPSLAARTTTSDRRLQADQARRPTSPTRSTGRRRGPIGVVTVAGDDRRRQGRPPAPPAATASPRRSRRASRDDGLKALVVRVDSPGGSVLASERIRQAILAAKAKKLPVVVSMGNVAASGGYWVATPADFIFAEPSTITGSIGVFGVLPSFEGTLAKLGIGADGIKTTPLSGEPDLLKGPSPEASRADPGRRRIDLPPLPRHRRRSRATRRPAEIDRIAQGRVWDGGTARQLGLVDGFGGMDEAIAKAAELAKLGDERGVTYLERPPSFERQPARDARRRRARRRRGAGRRLRGAGAGPSSSCWRAHRRSALDPGRAEHPGALPRMPAGRAAPRLTRRRSRLADRAAGSSWLSCGA